jgi:cytochrome P450 family 49 subfamily A
MGDVSIITFFVFCFRMFPVIIGNGRSLQADTVIGGYTIPKGVRNIAVFSNVSPLNANDKR